MEIPSVCLVFLYIMDGDRAASVGWCMVFCLLCALFT